jgi:Kef-type K+ transport system membrane component KefB
MSSPADTLQAAAAHGSGTLEVIGVLALVIVGARLGAALFRRLGQPEVLGELATGVVIGNLGLLGLHGWGLPRSLPGLDLLAEIGVLFLLFVTGLRSELRAMLEVGASSLSVAMLGVLAPIGLGFLTSSWLQPGHSPLVHWFAGAALCATSVGITARVLGDLGRTGSPAGRIILGAAVIDDVLGLVVLAVISGVIRAADRGESFRVVSALIIAAKAIAFLVAAIGLGRWISRRTFRVAARIEVQGLLLSLSLGACFGLSWLAGTIGLAPIVGAFAAGLVLESGAVEPLRARDGQRRTVAELIEPLSSFLTPVFFVLMGMRMDLSAFARPGVLWFAAVLTLAAVAGKQVCGLGVMERGVDRLAVSFGMIPRGEVGLIFAGIGAGLTIAGERVVDAQMYAAIVLMVAITTLLAPPLLSWRMRRSA